MASTQNNHANPSARDSSPSPSPTASLITVLEMRVSMAISRFQRIFMRLMICHVGSGLCSSGRSPFARVAFTHHGDRWRHSMLFGVLTAIARSQQWRCL